MCQLNITTPWEINSGFFSLFITKCPLPFFTLSLPLSLGLSVHSTLQHRLLCFGTYVLMRSQKNSIISLLTVAAEQCKVSLHLILVTKCYYTAVCWVSCSTVVFVYVSVSMSWSIYAQKELNLLNVLLVKMCKVSFLLLFIPSQWDLNWTVLKISGSCVTVSFDCGWKYVMSYFQSGLP